MESDGRWHKTPTSKTWFALDATRVIAAITESDDEAGVFMVHVTAPNGLGVSQTERFTNHADVIVRTDRILRDLGWR